jgi:hypothetical protein
VKVWAHRVTRGGNSEPISASIKIRTANGDEIVQLDANNGQLIRSINPQTKRLEIDLS